MKTLFPIIAVFLYSSYCHAQTFSTCNPYPKTITVTGSADMEIVPDEIYAQVVLREYKKKGEEKVELEKIKTDFLNKCKTAGIDDSDISIASYQGSNYSAWFWKRRKKDPDLYSSIAYQIKFNNSKKMDDLVQTLDDDATANFQVIKTSHSRIKEFRKQLKIKAIQAAKEKAIYLTESINEKIGEAINIAEPDQLTNNDNNNVNYNGYANENFGVSSGLYYKSREDGLYNSQMPSADFKKIKLEYKVTITFALK